MNNLQTIDFKKVKEFEARLDDVMEFIDTELLKQKLAEVESDFNQNPTEFNKVRLGIIYHEVALNLGFFSKEFKGFAQKSYDILSEFAQKTQPELQPFILSYRASALSLVASEKMKLGLIGKAFELFDDAIKKYGEIHYLPEFMRGSVAENLPFFYFTKRKLAKKDFQSIIDKNTENPNFANWKVMSFVYWAWAKQHQGKKYRTQALNYLDKAIALDPNYEAGRKRSEELKNKLLK